MGELKIAKILENRELCKNIFIMAIKADKIANKCTPGQFIEIYVDKAEHILPRPISIYDVEVAQNILYIVYQVVGCGTEYFSKLIKGDTLKIIAPLGQGYVISSKQTYCIVGGGIGIPPLYFLTKEILKVSHANSIDVFLGYRSYVFLKQDFEKLGVNVKISTDDGSEGFGGNVVELLKYENKKYDVIYSCGPKIMLSALAKHCGESENECFVSMEERMACGIGACVGCAIKTIDNKSENGWRYKKVCKDGPVFNSKEVVWDEY